MNEKKEINKLTDALWKKLFVGLGIMFFLFMLIAGFSAFKVKGLEPEEETPPIEEIIEEETPPIDEIIEEETPPVEGMSFKELLLSISEILIANIPNIVVLITLIAKNHKKITENINIFKKETYDENKNILKTIGDKFNQISKENFEINDKTIVRVDESLKNMDTVLSEYKDKLEKVIFKNEMLTQSNDSKMEMIIELLKLDSKKIADGSFKNIYKKFNMTQEELKKYPELLENDYKLYKDTMAKFMDKIGLDNFDLFLKEIGYEEQKRKKLQVKE
ncbi:MAG: hypothetical protein PHP55_10610 [Methanoculleus sp.]|uniref:hypothetical protein n=1 Tax=Methanoculleus sp. TaxID=90427 RepID=UPI0025F39105|nr:hypothetical protein [Methanoculleus sp.]MCK9319090.1 hypothetical protein [Methanoculleus sp.]MDD3934305.1 hypothetical protein [Methanoculleus sp.]